MNSDTQRSPLPQALRGMVLALLIIALPYSMHGATIWSGPITNFTQNAPDPSDQLTPAVAISRGGSGPLFNSVSETGSDFVSSPADTEWAFGSLGNYASLTYQSFAAIRNAAVPNLAAAIVNQPMVVHLISEDIYLSVQFSAWGRFGAGGFAYARSTPVAGPPTPTVSITSPTNNSTFTAPATFPINATTAVASGSVTNVAFFANGSPLGSDQSDPFSVSSGGLAAGSYGLTAVATAAGISSTSAVVNISVLAPGAIILSSPKITAGQFSFDYTASIGLNYVVENSSNLLNWLPLTTNTASSNVVHYTDGAIPGGTRHYRVGQVIP